VIELVLRIYSVNTYKKKLCIIIPAHWAAIMGGSQYQAKFFIESLASINKYEIYYLARRVDPTFKPYDYRIIQIADPRGVRRFGESFDAPRLINLLRNIKPDIIYQRVGCGYTGIAAHYARRNDCKMIWHVAHDMEVLPFERTYSHNIIFRYLEKKVLEYGIVHADDILVQTLQQGQFLQKNYGRKATAVIPNVQPLPEEKIIKTAPLKVVWIANLKPWKQPEFFIRLARDLHKYKDVHFTMIGRPPDETHWREALMQEISKLDNLKYLGGCTQEVVNHNLARAHIFVNTSIQEGFANTFIQAWMRKVPVVSLNVNPDGVFNNRSIGLFSGSYEKLKQDVIRLIEEPDLRERMGEHAQAYAFDKHSIGNFKKMIELIDK